MAFVASLTLTTPVEELVVLLQMTSPCRLEGTLHTMCAQPPFGTTAASIVSDVVIVGGGVDSPVALQVPATHLVCCTKSFVLI
jgi:hypothetical protein